MISAIDTSGRHACLPLILVALVGCGGGTASPPPTPAVPVITRIEPTGVIGSAGGWVRLEGEATNSPILWDWDVSEFGTTTETTATPRVFLSTAGPARLRVSARNLEGKSAPREQSVEVGTTPTAPRWSLTTPVGVSHPARQQTAPAICVTDSSIVLFVAQRAAVGGGIESPLFMTLDNASANKAEWIQYEATPSQLFQFSFLNQHLPQLRAHMGRLYLSSRGVNYSTVACANTLVPLSMADWHISSVFLPEQIQSSGYAATGSLAFVGDKPIVCGVVYFDDTEFSASRFYTNFIAVGSKPLPAADDDWIVIRLPTDQIDGHGTGSGRPLVFPYNDNAFAQLAHALPSGGVCFVQSDGQALLDYYYAPDEAAVRNNTWRLRPLGTAIAERGIPYGITADAERVYIAYYPADPADLEAPPDPARGLGLAMSTSPSGFDAPWNFQALPEIAGMTHFLAKPLIHNPLQLWGGRLIMLARDGGTNIALARALEPGIPAPDQWAMQRIADSIQLGGDERPPFDNPYATMTTHGLDCYVLFSRVPPLGVSTEAPSPLWLATAQGSW